MARRRRLPGAALVLSPLLAHAAPSTAVLATFLPPTARRGGRVSSLAGCRFAAPAAPPAVALTFDDGPSEETGRTLELLAELGLRATFFLVGREVARRPELVGAISAAGHEVACHGMEHRSHLLRPPGEVLEDLAAARATLAAAGAEARWFRPPFGHAALATFAAVRRQGLELVLWSRSGGDYRGHGGGEVARRVAAGLHPGAVVLLHDSDRFARPGTARSCHQSLPAIAEALGREGLASRTLGELVAGRT